MKSRACGLILLSLLLLGLPSTLSAASSLTFLNFSQVTPANKLFSFTNAGTSTLMATDVPINYTIDDQTPLLSPVPPGIGYLTMSSFTTPPVASTGDFLVQPMNAPNAITTIWIYTGKSSAPGTLILEAHFARGTITGGNGETGASFVKSGMSTLTFNSAVINLAHLFSADAVSLGYTGVTPALAIGSNNYLSSFVASGGHGSFSGTFSPEPTALAFGLTSSLVLAGVILRRRKTRA